MIYLTINKLKCLQEQEGYENMSRQLPENIFATPSASTPTPSLRHEKHPR